MSGVATEPSTKSICARVNSDVFRRVKIAAVMQEISIVEIVNQALLDWLTANEHKSSTSGTPTGA